MRNEHSNGLSSDNVNRVMLRLTSPEASNVNLSIGKSEVGQLVSHTEIPICWSEAELEESAIDSHLGQSVT